MSSMKAVAVTPGRREVGVVAHPQPGLATATDVKLRILDVGVCGTDREICAFEYGTPPGGSDSLVIGHESLGEVIDVGPGVSRVKKGDLVVPMVRRRCPHAHCAACRAGRQDFCFTGDFTERGIKQAHGFMTEFIVDDEAFMNVVPRALSDVAVLVEPLTIAEKAIAQVRKMQERLPWECSHGKSAGWGHCLTAVVLGAGPVGLLGAMALVNAGFHTTVYSRDPEPNPRADLVRTFGANYASSTTEPSSRLAERLGRIDLVYEAVGVSRFAFDVAQHLAPNGAFIFTGVPALKGGSSIDTDTLMRGLVLKNQLLLGSVNAGRDAFEGAIRHLEIFNQRWPGPLRSLITGRFPVDACRDLLLGKPVGIKNVLSFDGRSGE